jgi:hypothetical protein
VTDPAEGERSAATAGTARHLTDLEARYDTHLAALRKNAAELQAAASRDTETLGETASGEPAGDHDPI